MSHLLLKFQVREELVKKVVKDLVWDQVEVKE